MYSAVPPTTDSAQQPEVTALLKHPLNAEARPRGNRCLEAVNTQAGSATLYAVDAGGQALAASNWQTPDTFFGQNYRKRPYFQDSVAGQRSFFYGVGLTTDVPGLFIAAPVCEGSTVIGVVVVKVSLVALETSWARARDRCCCSMRAASPFSAPCPVGVTGRAARWALPICNGWMNTRNTAGAAGAARKSSLTPCPGRSNPKP